MPNKNNSQKSKKNVVSDKNFKGTGYQKPGLLGKDESRKGSDIRESK